MGLILDILCGLFGNNNDVNSKLTNETIKFFETAAIYSGEAHKFDYGSKIVAHGKGVAILENGDTFSGEFCYGKPKKGKYTFANGSYCDVKYSSYGDAKYSKPYGWRQAEVKEKITKDKDVYLGEVKDGKPNGIGLMKYDNTQWYNFFSKTDTYEGGFKNGLRHGVGKYIFDSGRSDVCVYIDGKEICKLEDIFVKDSHSQVEENDEKEEDDYFTKQAIESNKSHIGWLINEGRYEDAKRYLRDLDSDESIRVWEGSYSTTLSAEDWERELNERMKEEKETD